MKKTSPAKKGDDVRPEYDFDLARVRPNRFASRLKGKSVIAIVLDADVAEVFRSSEAVNAMLRSVISAMPQQTRRAATRKRRAS
jgi:uncharacterized protein (DUF4415 family)